MHEEIIFSGFGGQGALFAGQLLTYAALDEGRQVTWIPSYGPEMRGGTAHCTVIISDEPIGSPIIRNPTAAVVLNPASMDKYEPLLRPGGVLVVNSSLVQRAAVRDDITVVTLPANDIAIEVGDVRMANAVLLGALLGASPIVQPASVKKAMEEHIPERKARFIGPNKEALQRGLDIARHP
ncbi:MAG: 2-oxoacid:acceptor oxidoreductase family protein [Chloroflexi bacterium]|nr:2-oxoacid:acceptor oxidoreductase family protein [Chloroflexota bacterium]MBU1749510.1 2-oxoacid:acceptor oxidoreductase family protein [Chloroflexota bacterium]MBU1879545.1 2-oxoacid:acceptor oxidoreductase family protein [Chloroflexota bacterium]